MVNHPHHSSIRFSSSKNHFSFAFFIFIEVKTRNRIKIFKRVKVKFLVCPVNHASSSTACACVPASACAHIRSQHCSNATFYFSSMIARLNERRWKKALMIGRKACNLLLFVVVAFGFSHLSLYCGFFATHHEARPFLLARVPLFFLGFYFPYFSS